MKKNILIIFLVGLLFIIPYKGSAYNNYFNNEEKTYIVKLANDGKNYKVRG